MTCPSLGFVRVKFMDYQVVDGFYDNNVNGGQLLNSVNLSDYYVAVKIKEAEEMANGAVMLFQKRRTMKQDWNTFFDSHLYDGRVIHLLVMDKKSDKVEAEISIGVHLLAGYCRGTCEQPVDQKLNLHPSGALLVQLRYFHRNTPPPSTLQIPGTDKGPDIEITPFAVDVDDDEDELYGIAIRRHAVKQPKIFEVKGHKFIETFFKTPTFCSFCSEFLWGLSNQGFRCQACNCAVHQRCHERILGQCPGSAKNSTETQMLTERFNLNVPHRFDSHTFVTPTFCDHCGSLILIRGGLQCQDCRVNCHKRCQANMPNLCGINQKILSELLDTVRSAGISKKTQPGSSQQQQPHPQKQSSLEKQPSLEDDDDEYSDVYEALSNKTRKIMLEKPSVTDVPPPVMRRNGSTGQNISKPTARMSIVETIIPIKPSEPSRSSSRRPQPQPVKKYSLNDFQLHKVLGKGSFGKVLLAELKGSGTFFAVKALKKDVVLEDNDVECTMLEKRVLELGSQNPYLTFLHSTFQTQSHLFFVMEYLNGGDLMFHIQKDRKFAPERARFYAAEMICGLQFLHARGIIYRDLKPDNVLLDKDGHVKLADFGMCKESIIDSNKTNTFCGTPHYLAPEIIKGTPYDSSVDWFSFGVMLFEMLAGRLPFDGFDEDDMFHRIVHTQPKYPKHLKPDAISCIHLLLVKNPTQRLGMPTCPAGALRDHLFFKPIEWDLIEQRKIEPPFKPKTKSGNDASNFDAEFTREPARLTNISKHLLMTIDQTLFEGFSFTNPVSSKSATPLLVPKRS